MLIKKYLNFQKRWENVHGLFAWLHIHWNWETTAETWNFYQFSVIEPLWTLFTKQKNTRAQKKKGWGRQVDVEE